MQTIERSYAPASVGEAGEIMTALAGERATVTFAGGGTKQELGNPPDAEAIVRTERLARVIEYAPEDLVVTVEAGLTLAALQTHLAEHRQRLALDPPHPDRATIGGLIATNEFGPRRIRYGALRDHIIGVQIVRADGALARGGGRVVKNVAGFDIPKLMVGSLGTLGMIATATFRLHPVPETSRMVRTRPLSAPEVLILAETILALQLEPAVFLALRGDEGYTGAVVFEGFAAGVDEQIERFIELATVLSLGGEVVSPDERAVIHAAHGEARTRGSLRLKLSVPRARLFLLDTAAIAPIAATLRDLRAVAYPPAGIAFMGGESEDLDRTAAAIFEARAELEREGGTLVVQAAPPALRARVDVWGTPPPAFVLMDRLKQRFDPERRLNRGRFVGGL